MNKKDNIRQQQFKQLLRKNMNDMTSDQFRFTSELISQHELMIKSNPTLAETKVFDEFCKFCSDRFCQSCKDKICCTANLETKEMCFFFNDGCTIYKFRPYTCRLFMCSKMPKEVIELFFSTRGVPISVAHIEFKDKKMTEVIKDE